MQHEAVHVFWFRRDLRLEDNHGLCHALGLDIPVLPVFIFDPTILERLEDRDDGRVTFIHRQLQAMNRTLMKRGRAIWVLYGEPVAALDQVRRRFNVVAVFANSDDEPCAIARDERVAAHLGTRGIGLRLFKDKALFERADILKRDATPYSVFTPYARSWKAEFSAGPIPNYPSESRLDRLIKINLPDPIPSLERMGFEENKTIEIPSGNVSDRRIKEYARERDIPSRSGTSRMGVHLRFGTVSTRRLIARAADLSPVFLNELIWREFFMMVLFHAPRVVNEAYRIKYRCIPWQRDEAVFQRWCHGQTGYPLVDAGMRELNKTGFMHNRVRMVVASFLTKHLLIDWRWGERYFARKLLDYELSSNNGNWQWAAGTGCDAAPYFRIFNPQAQARKFDPQGTYIARWVDEYATSAYPSPMIDHRIARQRALDAYKTALAASSQL